MDYQAHLETCQALAAILKENYARLDSAGVMAYLEVLKTIILLEKQIENSGSGIYR